MLRILIETPLDLDLEQLLRSAAANLETRVSAGHVVPEVFDYMMDRLKAYYGDRGMAADLVDAVLAQRPTRPNDLDRRIKAVNEFRRLPEAASLAAANKRIRNILRKAEDEVPAETRRRTTAGPIGEGVGSAGVGPCGTGGTAVPRGSAIPRPSLSWRSFESRWTGSSTK